MHDVLSYVFFKNLNYTSKTQVSVDIIADIFILQPPPLPHFLKSVSEKVYISSLSVSCWTSTNILT